MTTDELWTLEKQKLEQSIDLLEGQIAVAEQDHRIQQSDRRALLRHKQNELVELGKRSPKKK